MTIDESRFEVAITSQIVDFTGDTLILPSVSIGSVPQLAIDALLDSQNAKRIFGQNAEFVASLDHRFCVPFLGGVASRASGTEKTVISGPMQLYRYPQAKVTILQQRSPILKVSRRERKRILLCWLLTH